MRHFWQPNVLTKDGQDGAYVTIDFESQSSRLEINGDIGAILPILGLYIGLSEVSHHTAQRVK